MNKIKCNTKKIKNRSRKIKNKRLNRLRRVSKKISPNNNKIGGWPNWFAKSSSIAPQPQLQPAAEPSIRQSLHVPVKGAIEQAEDRDNFTRRKIINIYNEYLLNKELNPDAKETFDSYLDRIASEYNNITFTSGVERKEYNDLEDKIPIVSKYNKGSLYHAILKKSK
jgi:hypothetical protein